MVSSSLRSGTNNSLEHQRQDAGACPRACLKGGHEAISLIAHFTEHAHKSIFPRFESAKGETRYPAIMSTPDLPTGHAGSAKHRAYQPRQHRPG